MAAPKSWEGMRTWAAELLERKTGAGVEAWNRRIADLAPADEAGLTAWLEEQGVTGYARWLLVQERFGYPEFLLASADELIEAQYADRPQLRPILEAVHRRCAITRAGHRPGTQDLCLTGHPAPYLRRGEGHYPEASRSGLTPGWTAPGETVAVGKGYGQ